MNHEHNDPIIVERECGSRCHSTASHNFILASSHLRAEYATSSHPRSPTFNTRLQRVALFTGEQNCDNCDPYDITAGADHSTSGSSYSNIVKGYCDSRAVTSSEQPSQHPDRLIDKAHYA